MSPASQLILLPLLQRFNPFTFNSRRLSTFILVPAKSLSCHSYRSFGRYLFMLPLLQEHPGWGVVPFLTPSFLNSSLLYARFP
jgi:hypothetical protein